MKQMRVENVNVYWKLSIKFGNKAYSNESNNLIDKNYYNSVKRRIIICIE